MKNFIHTGRHLTIPAPEDLNSGDLVAVGALVGVACGDAKKEAGVTLTMDGVYTLPKLDTVAFALGEAIYVKEKKLTKDSKDAIFVGHAVAEALQKSPEVMVRLA
jgi:predicted RecA/RadA family phage recombinase